MKIGLSTSMIQRGQSGVAQYVFSLVKALTAAQPGQHQFTLFVLKDDLPLFDFARETTALIPVSEEFRGPVKNIVWHQTVLPLLARKHRLDVLHVPSYRRMLWPQPCALVATIHDLAPFHVAEKYDVARMFYGRVVARRLAHRQNKIIAVSHNTRADLLEFFKVPSGNVTVVHNGLDHARFFPDSPEAAKRFLARHYDLRGPFFLYLARLEHPAKNHVRLIEAFNRFKAETKSGWQLVFGGGDWHGAQTIRAAIARSRFSRDIRCLGFVEAAMLPKLYRAAEVFVYPSLFEGFGFPPLEAMACGCPVLSSTRGGLGEVVGNAALRVEPEDVHGLKTQLARVAGDAMLRAELREAGLVRAHRFNWEQTAAQTLEVYASVFAPDRAPADPCAKIPALPP